MLLPRGRSPIGIRLIRLGKRKRTPTLFPATLRPHQAHCGVILEIAATLTRMIDLAYVVAGFMVGALVGMTGVGGGSLMTPFLIVLFGVHPATAVGTDLLYAAATKTGGTLVHGLLRTVEWRIVTRLAIGSVPATALTLLVVAHLDMDTPVSRHLITWVLASALFATAAVLSLRKKIVSVFAERIGELPARSATMLTVVVGAALGVLVSVSSVGAGALCATALVLLYPHLAVARIVGSDIAHAVPLTLIAGGGHWVLGSVDTYILGFLLIGSLPGIFVGSWASVRVADSTLRFILAGVLIVVGVKLIF